ncbi:DUF11 domain-containing protein [uncultured Chloroflexus sp.]|uniref:DUF11 domain-containing protein n=1 Tax=uncultured Chloroflexus sp. TaxID=214040 RepID=UPI0026098C40|nr:DUF11 domain-containing protein [uncultured Chloroflexus sp.]
MRHLVWRMLPIVLGGTFLLMALLSPPTVMVDAAPPLSITETSTAEPPTRTPTNTPVAPPTNTPTDTPVVSPTNTPTSPPVVPPTNTPTDTPVVPPTNTPTSPPVVPPTNTPTSPPVVPPTDTPTPALPPDSPSAIADLVLDKVVTPSVAQIGDEIVYTLTLRNIGNAPAVDVTVDDPLPAFARVLAASASVGTAQVDGNRVSVAVPVVAPGETITITIRAVVVTLPLPPDHRNVAMARTSSSEITTDNNTSSATVQPPLPDLTLAKSVSPSVAQVGDQVVYTLTIGNIGNAPATDVTLTDTLPPSLRLIGVTTTAGNINTDGNQVTVSTPSLAPGETIVVQVTAQLVAPLNPSNSVNTALVRTSSSEITTDNNTSSVIINSPPVPPPSILPQTAANPVRPFLAFIGLALVAIGLGALLQRRSYH